MLWERCADDVHILWKSPARKKNIQRRRRHLQVDTLLLRGVRIHFRLRAATQYIEFGRFRHPSQVFSRGHSARRTHLRSSTEAHVKNLVPSTPEGGDTPAAYSGMAHWWFTALDQRAVLVGAERWLTRVMGIHVDGFDLWIQIEAAAQQIRSFVIRVREPMSVEQAVAEIEQRIRASC
jgi:hypothetical protein